MSYNWIEGREERKEQWQGKLRIYYGNDKSKLMAVERVRLLSTRTGCWDWDDNIPEEWADELAKEWGL